MTDRMQPPDGHFPVVYDGDDLLSEDDAMQAVVDGIQLALGEDALVSVASDEDGDAWGRIETARPELITVLMSAKRSALKRSIDLDAYMSDNFHLDAYLVRPNPEPTEADGTETRDDPTNPRYGIMYELWFRPRVAGGVLGAARALCLRDEPDEHQARARDLDGDLDGDPPGQPSAGRAVRGRVRALDI